MFNLLILAGDQTWLASQLETYGVPAGISAAIGVIVGYGLTWLISHGLRKTSGGLTKVFNAGTAALQMTDANVTKLIESNRQMIAVLTGSVDGLKNEVVGLKNEVVSLKDQIVGYQTEVVSLHNEIAAQKAELQNGAVKIINLLKEPLETPPNQEA